ncbi:hypothetical protein [Streptomyces sp. NBC_00083]|uniref:hypothetical protein n=1 Tax=Streptomyces sp. NBC_00083 TaxID=2975647 RepID=UPI0022513F7F|nr:hypothetical protein [Streptomyces sp. NBC_00083]MCX5387972.1 hypothetical protein [Streptomyces sp. NBC_00083]
MDAMQQHMIDNYRAARLGTPAPPLPGTHDVAVLRDLRDYRRFEAVLDGRLATGRLRAALAHLIAPRHHHPPACH